MRANGTQTPHVLVDAHVFHPRGRGMSHFAGKFIEGLAAAPCEFQFTILSRFPERLPAGPTLRHVRIPQVPAPLWEQVMLPVWVRRLRPTILHALANTLPVVGARGVATVVTLHDVMFMHPDPEISAGENLVQKVGKLYRTVVCRATIPRCGKVLTDSAHSLAEIESRFPAQRGRVEVAYLGPSLGPPKPGPRIADEPFVLLPGGNHSRKNVRRAIRAFLRFRRDTGASWRLAVFGIGPAQLDVREFSDVYRPDELEAVRLLGYVPEDDLPRLFRDAEVVFVPSLYEGFGIPVLDALALGRPVVTSNVTSLPEIGGEAALYVDPRSIESMADALGKLYCDADLRRSLATRAGPQARKFQWEDLTSKTLAAYRALARARV